jgi:hypothetical protein
MINSLNGPVLLNDAFGALLSFNLAIMLKYVENPKVCGDKVEYGVPLFDDLDAAEKATILHRIVSSLFDSEAPVLKDNAYNAAALTALENYIKKTVEREIEMQNWSQQKFGKEDRIERTLTIAAFQSRYPHDTCPTAESSETLTFVKMIDRLFSEIRPKPHFLIADVPKTKRKILMQRLAVPNDYFAPLEGKNKIPEKDRREQCRVLLADAMHQCGGMIHRHLQTRTASAAMVAQEIL